MEKTKDRLFSPITRIIPKWITPNHITIIRILLVPVVGWLLWDEYIFWGAVAFAMVFFTDALDGTLARQRGQISRLGMVLDPLADKLLFFTAFIILGYHYITPALFWWTVSPEVALIVWSVASSVVLKARQVEYVRPASIYGKLKTGFQVPGLICLLFAPLQTLGVLLLWIGVAFSILNVCQAMRVGIKSLYRPD